ncbi:translation initiation factor eIF-2B subunit delta [Chrysoperla carnea]|uniref:translation initiation factor eIF-2B subunit delta n=1 Tax=Chrysoperla carnea TaxID=189513 RepID=UPI001D06EEB9|nr:translation initiation factor eIF-2B subunit delta [Chrysoperla carnea]
MESGKKKNLQNNTENEQCVENNAQGKLSNSIRRQLRRKRAKDRLRNPETSNEIQTIEFVPTKVAPKIIGVQPKAQPVNDSFDFTQLLGKKHDPNLEKRERGDSLVISSKLTKKIERKRTSRIRRYKKDNADLVNNSNDIPFPAATTHNNCSHNRVDVRLPLVGNENLHYCSYSGHHEEEEKPSGGNKRNELFVNKLEQHVIRHILDAKKQTIRIKTEDEINATKMSEKPVKDRATILAEREAKKLAKKSKKTTEPIKAAPIKLAQNESPQFVDTPDFARGIPTKTVSKNEIVSPPIVDKSPKDEIKCEPQKKEARRKSSVKTQGDSPTSPTAPVEVKKVPPPTVAKQVSSEGKSPAIKLENLTDDCKQSLENNDEGKSKAELRAERRAKQEAQRAAKAAAAVKKVPETPHKSKTTTAQEKKPTETATPLKSTIKKSTISPLQHKAQILFNHLYIDRDQRTAHVSDTDGIHPAMIRTGIQYQKGVIFGSNARCVAMLVAIKDMVKDFKTPTQAEYGRSLEITLKKCVQYLHSCRPISVSMTNALRFFKYQLTLLPNNVSDDQASNILTDAINTYIKEQIEMAGQAISITVQPKIINGDTILTYGCSSLIKHILLDAHRSGKTFRVVVVDSRPFLEGKEMLRHLVAAGIKCTYVLIATTSFIMASVSKVLLGAHALLANGNVMSRTGTAQVALMAKAHNVPVLVCCETYKFCERVQTDSFVYNEIADPDRLLINKTDETPDSDQLSTVIPLSLTYDVTPSDLVTAVVTELAILPCTSVPVILRIKPTDSSY